MNKERKQISGQVAFDTLLVCIFTMGCIVGTTMQQILEEKWGPRYSFCSSRLNELPDILDCTLRSERVVPPPLPPSVLPEPTRMPRNIIKG